MLDITTLAAWGEFLGGIAVVASLIYLASQIRQNSRLLDASIADTRLRSVNETATLMVQDAEVSRIFWDGIADRSSLSEADRRRFDPLLSILFIGNRENYKYYRDGMISRETWDGYEQGLRWQLQQPGVREWWREWNRVLPSEFRDFVEGVIREVEAAE